MGLEFDLLSYFLDYGVEKAIDCVMKRFSRKGEKTIEEHAYEVLEESLAIFCTKYGIEINATAFRENLGLRDTEAQLTNQKFLRNALIKATGLDIMSDQWSVWCDIVSNQIVSDEHEKLYRAIHFGRMCNHDANLLEPDWVRLALDGNTLDITPIDNGLLNELAIEIDTLLTGICWYHTLSLMDELIRNATDHGHAQNISLLIEESKLTLSDDGIVFDVHNLKATTCGDGGGRDALNDFESMYPDVLIGYSYKNNRNVTVITFPDKVFDVNGLCEVSMKPNYRERRFEIIQSFEQGKAWYYHIDFGKSELNYFSKSMACDYVDSLLTFAVEKDAVVFIGIPDGKSNHSRCTEIWDDIALKFENALDRTEKKHIAVCRY